MPGWGHYCLGLPQGCTQVKAPPTSNYSFVLGPSPTNYCFAHHYKGRGPKRGRMRRLGRRQHMRGWCVEGTIRSNTQIPIPPTSAFLPGASLSPGFATSSVKTVEVMQPLPPSTYVLVPRPALQISVAILGTSKDTGPDTSIQR